MTRNFVLTLAITVALFSALPFALSTEGQQLLHATVASDQASNDRVAAVSNSREGVVRSGQDNRGGATRANARTDVNITGASNANLAGQVEGARADGLMPRRPTPKRPNDAIRYNPGDPAVMYVKFRDEVKARASDQAHLHVVSQSQRDVSAFRALALQFNLNVEPLFKKSEDKLREIEQRAAENSGRAQPDLAGYMKVSGPADLIELAARQINQLPEVEYVEPAAYVELVDDAMFSPDSDWSRFERVPGHDDRFNTPGGANRALNAPSAIAPDPMVRPKQRTPHSEPPARRIENQSHRDTEISDFTLVEVGACCLPDTSCQDLWTEAQCNGAGGTFNGADSLCGNFGCAEGTCCMECVQETAFCTLPANLDELFDCAEEFGTQFECAAAGGIFLGPGVMCDEDDNICEEQDCGEAASGPCFSPNPTPSCNQFGCCNSVCSVDPFCCDSSLTQGDRGNGHWDELCVFVAEQVCDPELHPCESVTAGPCTIPNASPGCNQPGYQGCCGAICSLIPSCCTQQWHQSCADAAEKLCMQLNPNDPTPDLSIGQGYLTSGPWDSILFSPQLQFVADELVATRALPRIGGPILEGWTGEGYSLPQMEDFADVLVELAHPCCANDSCDDPNLCDEANLSQGEGTRVATFYPTAFVNIQPNDPSQTHEDLLGRVNYPETDQTQIITDISVSGLLTGDFGTAVLGILGANPDNGSGVSGMAPGAELYFFPTVSFEEGGRLANAVMNAIDLLGTGDIFVFPFTPRPAGDTLARSPVGHNLISLAGDLGITSFISAGDGGSIAIDGACGEISEITPPGLQIDSGAVVVGGVTPGLPYYRHPRSRFCLADETCEDLQTVHISGWGAAVVTLGFGDLFLGYENGSPSKLRSYTGRFGSWGLGVPADVFGGQQEPTSGAGVAQVAALAARLQGVARQMYDIALSPPQLRDALTASGFCQAGRCLGAPVQPFGTSISLDGACVYDLNPDATPARVGSWGFVDPQSQLPEEGTIVFTSAHGVAEFVVIAGYFDGCQGVSEAHVVRGQYLQGNLFSLCEVDSNFYIAASEPTSQGDEPSNKPPQWASQLNNATYNVNGQVADVMIVAHAPSQPIFGLAVTFAGQVPSVPTFNFVQVYDWEANIWVHGGFTQGVPGVPFTVFTSNQFLFNPNRFVRNSDNAVLVRGWSFAFSGPTGPTDPSDVSFELFVDELSVEFSTPGIVPAD